MKRLRRFDEASSNEIDAEYVRNCFADLIDSGKAKAVEKSSNNIFSAAYGSWIEIHCLVEFPDEPKLGDNPKSKLGASWLANTRKIGDSIKRLEEAAAAMREIEICIERLADEYPDYCYKIGGDNSALFGGLRWVINVVIWP